MFMSIIAYPLSHWVNNALDQNSYVYSSIDSVQNDCSLVLEKGRHSHVTKLDVVRCECHGVVETRQVVEVVSDPVVELVKRNIWIKYVFVVEEISSVLIIR